MSLICHDCDKYFSNYLFIFANENIFAAQKFSNATECFRFLNSIRKCTIIININKLLQ